MPSRHHQQINRSFARTLAKCGVPIQLQRGNLTGTALAIHSRQPFSTMDQEGAEVITHRNDFLMNRADYKLANELAQPKPGDIIRKTETGEWFQVIPDDEGKVVDDNPPEINQIRIPAKKIQPQA